MVRVQIFDDTRTFATFESRSTYSRNSAPETISSAATVQLGTNLPIPGPLAGSGAVLPINLDYSDKSVAPADSCVFARAARILERPRTACSRSRNSFVLPRKVSLVASKIGDDAVATRPALFVVHVGVVPRRTLDAGSMK